MLKPISATKKRALDMWNFDSLIVLFFKGDKDIFSFRGTTKLSDEQTKMNIEVIIEAGKCGIESDQKMIIEIIC